MAPLRVEKRVYANTCYLEKENTEVILEEAEKKLFNMLPQNQQMEQAVCPYK